MNDDWFRARVRKLLLPDGAKIDVHADAAVSRPTNPPSPGAWVQAWVWVPTDRKEAGDAGENATTVPDRT